MSVLELLACFLNSDNSRIYENLNTYITRVHENTCILFAVVALSAAESAMQFEMHLSCGFIQIPLVFFYPSKSKVNHHSTNKREKVSI